MGDPIFSVDPNTKELTRVESASFSELGIRERGDLEQWIILHPDVLGERLLPITSEFSRFDKSSRRLDILALDADGILVVIELKLDVAASLADQQAIRYAAFCSNMRMQDIVTMLSRYHGCSLDDAKEH